MTIIIFSAIGVSLAVALFRMCRVVDGGAA